MRVHVLGAGIVGVCTAWYLRERGFEVTVIDRREDVALEASAGNAGLVAPGYVSPWASPGMPVKILKYLMKPEAPVIWRPQADPAHWRWIRRWLAECDLERYRRNRPRMQRVARYSLACLTALRQSLAIEYARSQGVLQLFRGPRDLELARPAIALLEQQGIAHRLLDARGCAEVEPALAGAAVALEAGVYLPEDEAGDCARFARTLRARCEEAGVAFRFATPVEGLLTEGGRVTSLRVRGAGAVPVDRVVVALASDSVGLLAPLGIEMPIYPVKGYSVSLRVRDPPAAPRAALMDEAYKVAITRLGDTVRVAGTAELGDRALAPRAGPVRTLHKVLRDWFPRACEDEAPVPWVGARPMTPDGPPLLGPTALPNLFLNVGHGSTGWAMAAGSARAVADLVAGREPEIDLEGLTLDRYRARDRA